ncbi:MAG: hypothetical protein JWN04_6867 [Myxococcaceae bacterium]|nr:hypothetical protein [Myxococcaceae bacterium]
MTSSPLRHPRKTRGRTLKYACIAALGVACVSAAASSASAQAPVDCTTLPNPIFGIGGSAATNLIGRVAVHLAGATPPITVVYIDPGACNAMTGLVPNGATPVKSLAALSTTYSYWLPTDAVGKPHQCSFPSGDTTTADWGAMAQLPGTCAGTVLPSDVGDFVGPITGISLFVPNASQQRSISAEAVYYIYGLGVGTGHDVAPWTVPAAIASRSTSSAAGILLALAAGLPTNRPLLGTDTKKNQQSIDYVTSTSPAAVMTPEAALGFASTETVDANRDKVRTLAFKAQGQNCAYPPDTDLTGTNSTDKKNLREGRYFLWNPHHFYAKVDPTTKQVVNPNLAKFINYVTSKEELPTSTAADKTPTFLDLQIANGNIPQCAMRVTRTGDMGPLSSFQPDKSCGCYFDFKTTGSTSCKPCSANSDCPASAPSCNVGYCEVK